MMRSWKGWAAAGLCSLAVGFGLEAGLAQQQKQDQDQGAAERAGEKVDEAGRSIRKRLERAGDSIRGQFERARQSVHNMGVEARVYGRLHWDKALQGSTLEIHMSKDVATLKGTVPNAAAKAKAVVLARDTVGVGQVVDQLAVQPPHTTPETPGGASPDR